MRRWVIRDNENGEDDEPLPSSPSPVSDTDGLENHFAGPAEAHEQGGDQETSLAGPSPVPDADADNHFVGPAEADEQGEDHEPSLGRPSTAPDMEGPEDLSARNGAVEVGLLGKVSFACSVRGYLQSKFSRRVWVNGSCQELASEAALPSQRVEAGSSGTSVVVETDRQAVLERIRMLKAAMAHKRVSPDALETQMVPEGVLDEAASALNKIPSKVRGLQQLRAA